MKVTDLQNLQQFCQTANQKKVFNVLIDKQGNIKEAAKVLDVGRRAIEKIVNRVQKNAETRGYSPEHNMTHAVPSSFIAKGISLYYNKDGEVTGQWVKANLKAEAEYEMMKQAIEGLLESVDGKYTPSKIPTIDTDDLLVVYNLGDPHVGMMAWQKESGDDFDLKIVENDMRAAMKSLVASSPASKQAMIIDLGDYFHSDSMDNTTRKSGNTLDVDSRWAKVLEIGLHIMIELVVEALAKHETVKVINAIGNHNEHSAIFLSLFLKAWFRNEPRVIVEDSPAMHLYHQFGKNLIGVTHGHTSKHNDLPEIMAHDCQDIWSSTQFRYWYVGHIHHDSVKEYRTCKVESFRTLAAKDAWHAGQGYRSGRDMKAIVLHKDYGEIQRNTVNVVMLRDKV